VIVKRSVELFFNRIGYAFFRDRYNRVQVVADCAKLFFLEVRNFHGCYVPSFMVKGAHCIVERVDSKE